MENINFRHGGRTRLACEIYTLILKGFLAYPDSDLGNGCGGGDGVAVSDACVCVCLSLHRREHNSASHLSSASSNHGSSPSKDSPPKASSQMAAAEDFDVDQILGMGKHRGARGSDDLLGAIRGGRLDAVDEVNAQERRRNQEGLPRGNRGAVQKLSMDVRSLRGQYEGFKTMVQKELNVSREMATLRAAVFRMVNTVRHSDSNAKAAEELALREREKYEQAQSEMQEIRGNIRVFCRVRKATTTDPLQERGDAATVSFPADDAICVRDGEQRCVCPGIDACADIFTWTVGFAWARP